MCYDMVKFKINPVVLQNFAIHLICVMGDNA